MPWDYSFVIVAVFGFQNLMFRFVWIALLIVEIEQNIQKIQCKTTRTWRYISLKALICTT